MDQHYNNNWETTWMTSEDLILHPNHRTDRLSQNLAPERRHSPSSKSFSLTARVVTQLAIARAVPTFMSLVNRNLSSGLLPRVAGNSQSMSRPSNLCLKAVAGTVPKYVRFIFVPTASTGIVSEHAHAIFMHESSRRRSQNMCISYLYPKAWIETV